jgi:hypothetical protein
MPGLLADIKFLFAFIAEKLSEWAFPLPFGLLECYYLTLILGDVRFDLCLGEPLRRCEFCLKVMFDFVYERQRERERERERGRERDGICMYDRVNRE